MQRQLEAVAEFHRAFGLGIRDTPTADLGESTHRDEYWEAVQNKDLTEIADALGDMLYILCGTLLEHGLQHKIEAVFEEIQRSNMSKLGADGKPVYREDGKVMKGPNYFKPDVAKILER
jgi:predicted HAD superfamily Cof-like phosphohydrolase